MSESGIGQETQAYRLDTSGISKSKLGQAKIFACNASKDLAERIAVNLGMSLGKGSVSTFSNGEIYMRLEETVRDYDCYIVQSTSEPVNNNLMELLVMADAMRRASAKSITAVIPFFGYARQDRKAKSREPITAKLVANLISTAGVDRVITMDLHSQQIQGFFDIPVDHMIGSPLMVDYYKKNLGDKIRDMVVVTADVGGIKMSRAFASRLDMPIAIIDKHRPQPNVSVVKTIIGDVEGRSAIIADDMIDTAGSIVNAAEALVEKGATEVYACCTHGILSGPAIDRLQKSPIKELLVLDTINLPMEKRIPKIKVLSTSHVFAQCIYNVQNGVPLSDIYDRYA